MRALHLLAAALFVTSLGASAQTPKYPEAAKKPVTDTYYGTTVSEDYRWLEDGKDPTVREWSLKQLEVTRAFLDKLPQRQALKEKLTEIYSASPVRYFTFQQSAGGFFAL